MNSYWFQRKQFARGRQMVLCAVLLTTGGLLVQISSCNRESAEQAKKGTSAQTSAVNVQTEADGIHVQTSAAEFVLTPSGYLKSSLKQDGHEVTLDDPGSETGTRLTAGRQNIDDIVFDLKTARISGAQGKLGRLGKHVEISGSGKSNPNLKETLTLEIYDDFPALALLSASLRNDGGKEISLENVPLQEHRLNASLADGAAAAHEMWSFFGSSLKWGKDDVLPIPAKFEQQNPFGAPVECGSTNISTWRSTSSISTFAAKQLSEAPTCPNPRRAIQEI